MRYAIACTSLISLRENFVLIRSRYPKQAQRINRREINANIAQRAFEMNA